MGNCLKECYETKRLKKPSVHNIVNQLYVNKIKKIKKPIVLRAWMFQEHDRI